ncbi:Sterol desaturase [Fimbriiglobus ruber]|uniref:Sterol desaturase n=1 Tax=Fimbriiglobus ruber TaxID=1908690 RepID=A0A225DBZ9_9BACT|nr:Sterol desaturase [Fimbriiglobus ruber]
MLLGSPEIHHWHHDRDRDAGNYANLSPLMDVLFGTYHRPPHEPESFGLNEPAPKTYLAFMIQPFLPRARRNEPPRVDTDVQKYAEIEACADVSCRNRLFGETAS